MQPAPISSISAPAHGNDEAPRVYLHDIDKLKKSIVPSRFSSLNRMDINDARWTIWPRQRACTVHDGNQLFYV